MRPLLSFVGVVRAAFWVVLWGVAAVGGPRDATAQDGSGWWERAQKFELEVLPQLDHPRLPRCRFEDGGPRSPLDELPRARRGRVGLDQRFPAVFGPVPSGTRFDEIRLPSTRGTILEVGPLVFLTTLRGTGVDGLGRAVKAYLREFESLGSAPYNFRLHLDGDAIQVVRRKLKLRYRYDPDKVRMLLFSAVRLPTWQAIERAFPEERAQWMKAWCGLVHHELGHTAISRTGVHDMLQAILQLEAASPEELAQRAQHIQAQGYGRILTEHDRLDTNITSDIRSAWWIHRLQR